MFTPPGPPPPTPPVRRRSRTPPQEVQEVTVVDGVTGACRRYAYVAGATVAQLKRRIQDNEGVPANQQRLIADGEIMEDTLGIVFYTNFSDKIVVLQRIGAMQIFVHFPTKTVALHARASDRVGQLKRELSDLCGVPISHQRVFLADVLLEDDMATLGDYNIQNESALHIMVLSIDSDST